MPGITLGKETSAPDPTQPAHVATKRYVDPRVDGPAGTDLNAWITSYLAPMNTGQLYREPTPAEAAQGVTGVRRLGIAGADAASQLTPLGFTITTGIDSITKRPYTLAVNEPGTVRAWGAYLLDLTEPVGLLIGVPHPVLDANTELMGLHHWRAVPGSLLMVAGAHPGAAAGLADVTLQTGSFFHQVASSYATNRIPQLQWHGYADATAPGLTQVISAGQATVGTAIKRGSTELAAAGFTVGNGWDSSGSGTPVTATTNVQGIDAANKNSTFISVENNATVRSDSALRAKAVTALVAAEIPELAYADGAVALAQPVTGQFPKPVGTTNTVGTSTVAARSDHIHAERQATLDRITALEALVDPVPPDSLLYGDVVSTIPRSRGIDANGMDNGFYTITSLVAPRSVTVTKIRFAVVGAGTAGTTPTVALQLHGGAGAAQNQLATAPLTGAMLTTTGVKELALSAAVDLTAGNRYTALFYVAPNAFSARPTFASAAAARSVLVNPVAAQTFAAYKAATNAPPTSINTSDGTWNPGTNTTAILWWALL
jgi:hypothetical protein